MKSVLCFGDSNTYGYDPAGMRDGTAVRYAQDVRWWCPRCASTVTMCTPMPT